MEASQVSKFRSAILSGTTYDDNSVRDAIREVFEPIAEGEVEVDEEIMPYVPRAVFPIMTIHQAKGLEFPLVIVDVGSDFRTNHHTQRPFRYSQNILDIHLTEDQIANHSPVGLARQQGTGLDRAFDDLIPVLCKNALNKIVSVSDTFALNGMIINLFLGEFAALPLLKIDCQK